jgi:hypothetical protein
MRKATLALAAALAWDCAAATAESAEAQSVPAPYIHVQTFGTGGVVQDYAPPGTYTGSAGVASVTLAPEVSAESLGDAVAIVEYAFSANGEPNIMVPVSISYLLSSRASGDAIGVSSFSTLLYGSDGSPEPRDDWYTVVCSASGIPTCSLPSWTGLSTFSGSATGYVPSNTPIYIALESSSGVVAGSGGSASAFADPQITLLDPNFSLQLPDGVGNATGLGSIIGAVPEPSTWALMLLGFGAIGIAARRNRKADRLPQLA